MVRVSAHLLTHCLISEQIAEPLHAQLLYKTEDNENLPCEVAGALGDLLNKGSQDRGHVPHVISHWECMPGV